MQPLTRGPEDSETAASAVHPPHTRLCSLTTSTRTPPHHLTPRFPPHQLTTFPLPAQFGKSFACGTLRIDEPTVYVRDNEPQPVDVVD